MAPGGNKRKRPERQSSRDEGSGRPSPHRPQDLGLAQHGQQHGGSRGGRGGGGGGRSSGRRSSRQMESSPVNGIASTAPNAASPSLAPPPGPRRDSSAAEGSRSATPSQNTIGFSQPPPPPVEEQPNQPPAPYFYEHISDEVAAAFAETGKDIILQIATEANEQIASTLLQELIRAGLDGRIGAFEAGDTIRQIISHHAEGNELDIESMFLSTMSLLDEADHKNSHFLTLVAATDVDPEVIRRELEIPILQALSLVRGSFLQMRTRKTTNLLYRQANYNLLREESEGYAKLVTEYFNTANEATHDHAVSAERAFERITALVGSFDLDVGRVLDITLDISANLLVRAYGFFIKFYRCSSWWPDSGNIDNIRWEDQGFTSFPSWALPGSDEDPHSVREGLAEMRQARDVRFWDRVRETGMDAFYELGMRRIVDFEDVLSLLQMEVEPEVDAKGKETNQDRRKRITEDRKYMAETGMLPPLGNSDAAQLLGFKLRFYASSARDAQDVLPENLIFLAALLIKIGFISLRDLYPHLYPPDEKMGEDKTRLEKEKAEKEAKERPGVGSNALASAGALTDDTVPVAATRALRSDKEKSGGSTPKPEKKEDEANSELPPPANQKLQLLKALLLIGALPEALYILGRFPWLVDVDYTLPPYLQRIASQMLSTVAVFVRPLNRPDDVQIPKGEIYSTVPRPDGSLLFQPRQDRKPTRWLGLDTVEKTDGLSYRHYYPDWYDNVPVCQNIEDVFLLCNTFLGYLGVKIGQDAKLYGTLLRVAKYSLNEDFSEANQTRWLDMMRRLLVPALSLTKHNAGLTQEVYELLKLFPTTTRYNVYAEWYFGKTSRLPDMRVAFDHNRAEVKDVLRRVTNESGKKQARALAKVAFSSPGNVMIIMINQIESYSNMIPSLVECTRYFPLLAYDVLTWCLINSLSGQGRDRMQKDGMLASPWLQALSQFVASLFYRYTALTLSPILQYLASELRAGNSTDLEMFEQLLAEMAGIRSDLEFNDAQVLAMAGGAHLQARTVLQLADKRHERKLPAQRLIKSLSEPGLIAQMLISVAQERQMYSNHDASKYMPLKVLGTNLDKIQQVFAQYLDVLKTHLTAEEFEAQVPDVVSLVADFGLPPAIAFTIGRYCIAQRMLDFDSAKKSELGEKKQRLSQEQSQVNGDVAMQDKQPTTNGDATAATTAEVATNEVVMEDSKTPAPAQPDTAEPEVQPWHAVLQPIIQRLPEATPRLAEAVSIPFFVCFWTRSLQDILVHTNSYDNEVKKLKAQMAEVNADRSDKSASATKERDRKGKALFEIQNRLTDELKTRIASYQKTRNRISRQEKDHWFARSMDREESDARHIGLLQECFLPRAMLSSLDAHYSFLMLKILHDNGTPGFSTMRFLAQLFRKQELATLIFQCTAMEAQHFGRFLYETLKLLHHWHSDKATFEREALGEKQKLPGFAKTLDANGDPQVVLEFEEYRRLLFNWHSYLHGALSTCFESDEYMYIRNGIIVLRCIVPVFPTLNFMGHNMVKLVTKISDEDSRKDLQLSALSLLGPLKNREKQWLLPQAFRLNDAAKEAAKAVGNEAASAGSDTPQPSETTTKLNATAAEFLPSSSLTNGSERKGSVAGREDGEIEDEKQSALQDGDSVMKDVAEEQADIDGKKVAEQEGTKMSELAPTVKEMTRASSKPSTPAPIPSKPPAQRDGRQEAPRASAPPPASARSHALPPRPNKPLPAPPAPERVASRYGARERDESFGRLTRPSDLRPASRDRSPPRTRPRTPERDAYQSHSGRGPARDDRGPPSRSARDDSWVSSRRDQPQPPTSSRPALETRDRSNSSATTRPPQASHGERADESKAPPRQAPSVPQSGSAETVHHENPARLALINEPQASRDKARELIEPRRDRESRDDRSAAPSRQHESRGSAPDAPQEPHSDRPSDLTPTGPKRGSGRLSRDFGSGTPSEPASERLNGSQDFASGARPPPFNGPSGRLSRTNSGVVPSINTRTSDAALPASPATSRPPESPASFRPSNLRQSSDRRAQGSLPPSTRSVPTTPASENGPAVHPSRLSQVEVPSAPVQPSANSPTTAPPSAPRGAARPPIGTPTGPASTNSALPSGPASAAERSRRPERRQLGNINATLQGTHPAASPNGQSVNFRGAASARQIGMPAPASTNAPQVQSVASSIDAPSRRPEPHSTDSQQRPTGRPASRPDLFQNKHSEDARPNTPRRGDEEYNDRQRGSRNSSRERRPASNAPPAAPSSRRPEDRRPRDEREGREGPPQGDHRYSERPGRAQDDYGPRRPPPPSGPPPSFSNNAPPQSWDRGGERRGPPRRDGPGDNDRSVRGNLPPDDFRGSRRDEERRGDGRAPRDFGPDASQQAPPPPPPPPPPGTRKRRHEDAPFDESKRRRSGR